MENNLPSKNDDKELSQIKNWLTLKLQDALTWINTEEGQTFGNAIKSLGSFVMGDPTGVILPYIFDLSNSTLRRRFLINIEDLNNILEQNRSKINMDFVMSDEGQKILKDTMKNIIHEANEEKIKYLKSFIISSYTEPHPDSALIKSYYKILENMEPIHIKLLTVLKEPEKILRDISDKRRNAKYLDEKRPQGMKNGVILWRYTDDNDDLNLFYLKTDPLVYQNALKDFLNWNVIDMVFQNRWIIFQDNTFGENFANAVRDIILHTTPFGKKFIDFIYSTKS